MTEQDILDQFFNPRFNPEVAGILLGPGDDCALLQPPEGQVLAITTDTLVEGVHFFKGTDPYDIGYKAIAVNLSDLAAMGAKPMWMLGSFTLPHADPLWLSAFSKGVYACLNEFGVALVGGNLTRGPLVLSFTALGFLPEGQGVKRSGAQDGDYIAVTGLIGEAAWAFSLHQQGVERAHIPAPCFERLHRPKPRVEIGQALRKIATSMIDLTDGLVKDSGRLARASGLGMDLRAHQIPLPQAILKEQLSPKLLMQLISFGDDYELCFTLPALLVEEQEGSVKCLALERLAQEYSLPITIIGRMKKDFGLSLIGEDGRVIDLAFTVGFDHFQKSN